LDTFLLLSHKSERERRREREDYYFHTQERERETAREREEKTTQRIDVQVFRVVVKPEWSDSEPFNGWLSKMTYVQRPRLGRVQRLEQGFLHTKKFIQLSATWSIFSGQCLVLQAVFLWASKRCVTLPAYHPLTALWRVSEMEPWKERRAWSWRRA
jgi:hypothetical protein